MTSNLTSTATTNKNGTFLRVVGILFLIAGAVMIVAGGAAWGTISSQLRAEGMTVAPDAKINAGKVVAGPFTAWAQQDIIQTHLDAITDGQSYAELGDVVNQAKEEHGEDSPEVQQLDGLRTTAMNASLLRTSLFTSILAFGVSFLVMGLGLSTGLTGIAFYQLGKRR